jgi:hypothetical protein
MKLRDVKEHSTQIAFTDFRTDRTMQWKVRINSFIRLIKYRFYGADFREIHSNPVTFCGHLL